MPKQSKITVIETPDALRKMLQSSTNHKVKLKIRSLLLLQSGNLKRQKDIASHLSIGYSTIKDWYRDYSQNGISSFLTIKAKGKPKSIISEEVHEFLRLKLNNSEDPLLGYWDAVIWVKKNFQLDIKYSTLRK